MKEGAQWTGEGGEKLLSSRGTSLAIRTSGVLCVLLVRLLRVGKEGIHTGVQAPQKAPAAVGPRPYSDEACDREKEQDRTICSRLHPLKVAKSRPATHQGLTRTKSPAVSVEANAKISCKQSKWLAPKTTRITSKTSDDESSWLQCQVQWVEIIAISVSF